MKRFLNNFKCTWFLIVLLSILSLSFTQFYSNNVLPFLLLSTAFVTSIFLFERMFNRKGDLDKQKGLKMLVVWPAHLLVYTALVITVFTE
ncbi:hypothetical protein JOC54_004005 [Alkalihalobacillus xiaoxiensis]|uniref:Uncharacterized protein n=1 Tax=Shouchella xiaoxiensis TaxID=766895 RepID=A0ABS2SYV6_9BACI|nr:hypothetical protein [Shouchella xiaoxiensis]MBM7840712.1 hypothetical protein [Shouchella xiaoxiensis]